LFVWRFGGAALGTLTAWLGPTGVMVCTSAVERTVHQHLVEQIAFLDRADAELAATVRAILIEEDEHLSYADEHHDPKSVFAKGLATLVAAATEALIWLSTRGDSRGLRKALRVAA
jgi:ubiquinone biosynthesis monooxygenase Coq7